MTTPPKSIPTYMQRLRDAADAVSTDPSPYAVVLLDAALKVAEAEDFMLGVAKRSDYEARRKTLPPGYEPLKGQEPWDNGFKAPDGRQYGYWVPLGTMREEAWNHAKDPDEFDYKELDTDGDEVER